MVAAVAVVLLTASCSTDDPDEALPAAPAATTAESNTPPTAADETLASEPQLPATDDDPDGAPTLSGPLPLPQIDFTEIGSVEQATEVTSRPGDDRVFAVEQVGRVVALHESGSDLILDITPQTVAESERGLLGLAFHPAAPLGYVHFTDLEGNTVVAEFAVDEASGTFDVSTQRTVLTVEQPYSNHNGGELAFGPDDMLYLGLGDGGSGGDPERHALDLTSPLGKIHRIDPLTDDTSPFAIPAGNPFSAEEGHLPTIWSYGLRNPWKFSFDSVTGDLWIADVGQNEIEEISRADAMSGRDAGHGVNFGWSAWEGDKPFNDDQSADDALGPVLTYSHDDGHCSVSGGAVARGEANDDLTGWYVFGDYCSGTIWGYDTTSDPDDPVVVELGQLPRLAGIAAGPGGALYAFSQEGPVVRLTPQR